MRTERIITLVVLLASLGFVMVLVPLQTETVTYGYMSPDTLPRTLGWIMVALAAIQLVNPLERPSPDAPDAVSLVRALVSMCFVALCAAAIGYIGFLAASIILAAGACLILRERRWQVIATASLILPLAVWAVVTQLLGRSLP